MRGLLLCVVGVLMNGFISGGSMASSLVVSDLAGSFLGLHVDGDEVQLGVKIRAAIDLKSVAAMQDDRLAVTVPQAPEGSWAVSLWSLKTGRLGDTVSLGEHEVAALQFTPGALFIGQQNTLSRLSLIGQPEVVQFRVHPNMMRGKAYDVFAMAGSWLVAIDDRMMPFYADSFSLSSTSVPSMKGEWRLPSTVNGHYYSAALNAHAEGEGVLYTLVSFGVRAGHGQILTALPVKDHQVQVVPGASGSYVYMRDQPNKREEFVPRGSGQSRLLAGDAFSRWESVSFLAAEDGKGSVLLPAGPRGLWVFPGDFTAKSQPKIIPMGGDCLDVKVVKDRVWGLVAKDEDHVDIVEVSLPSGEVRHRLTIQGGYRRFVR